MEPYNFSFIDNTIAGSGIPTIIENIDFYLDENIEYVISLTPQKPLISKYQNKIKFIHYPVLSIPSDKIIEDYIIKMSKIKDDQKKAVVHCQYGQERTGLFLAIYLMEFERYSSIDAIEMIRKKRPGSLLSTATTNFVMNYKIKSTNRHHK